jgi:hypothetical protein
MVELVASLLHVFSNAIKITSKGKKKRPKEPRQGMTFLWFSLVALCESYASKNIIHPLMHILQDQLLYVCIDMHLEREWQPGPVTGPGWPSLLYILHKVPVNGA